MIMSLEQREINFKAKKKKLNHKMITPPNGQIFFSSYLQL